MLHAGHRRIASDELSTNSQDRQKLTRRLFPVSSFSGITKAPCIRFTPGGAVSYSKPPVQKDLSADSAPHRPSLGKRAFLKTAKLLRRTSNLNFPPVESPYSQDQRPKSRWTLQSPLPDLALPPSPPSNRTSFHVSRRSLSSSYSLESSSSESSDASTIVPETPTEEAPQDEPTLKLSRSRSILSALQIEFEPVNRRSTIRLTNSSYNLASDISDDCIAPFSDLEADDENQLQSRQQDWDGWNTMEVRAKLRKLR
ncbi:hypothetical protein V5O48_002385 [Marasmius crinis-equi]|uniref:Uncharacterized protein n=1 Tax=Marasmius crinis-equi TaxID=585013 RepID=A0ABR3FW48_9AGAR